MKRSLLLLLCVVFASISAYAVNMPGAPIYNSKPSARVSTDSVYKKSTSDYKAPSQAVNNGLSSANLSGNAHCMTEAEYDAGLAALRQKHAAEIDASPFAVDGMKHWEEYKKYNKTAFSNCLKYYNTVPNPDCTKLDRLWVYMALSEDKNALSEIKSSAHLKAVCGESYDYKELF